MLICMKTKDLSNNDGLRNDLSGKHIQVLIPYDRMFNPPANGAMRKDKEANGALGKDKGAYANEV